MASATYLSVVIGATATAYWLFFRKHSSNLPPGPKGQFLVGNLSALMLQGVERAKTYGKWFEEYGHVVHLQVLWSHTIILNSAQAASDLMDKRAAIYSHRPRMAMLLELVGANWVLTIASGEPHRERRSLAQRYFLARLRDWQHVQLDSCQTLVRNLLADPNDWAALVRLSLASTILRICYGYEITRADDSLLELVEEADKAFDGGPYLVDVFPWLKYCPSWLPGGRFHKDAVKTKTLLHQLRDVPFNTVRKEMAAGTASPSFVSTLLSEISPDEDPEPLHQVELIRDTASVMYGAGMESTVSLMYTFFSAMVLHSDVQRRAQRELDAVLGQDRLPTFDDRPSLPFIEAIILELLRWNVVTPLGFPHMVIEEEQYLGFRIPKGSTVFGNMWAILRDPTAFPNPEHFDPSRFLAETQGSATARKVVESTVFGWGRRTCPGRHVGQSALFIMISHILACFDVCKPKDDAGNEFEPVPEFDDKSIVRRARPMPCTIKARQLDKVTGLIRLE